MRLAIIFYGLLNAAAYCMLLPLWEGFDEAYHYGYVQFLSTHGSFPVLGEAKLSREIWHAFELVPVSHYLQPFTHAPTSFSDYFKLPREEREARRRRLESLPAIEKVDAQPDKDNYEVNQSPIAYVWMAAWDRAFGALPITNRVLWLRLICSALAVLLLAHATLLLAHELKLSESATNAALFCVFSAQMLYGVICHVCNDWVAVPLFVYFIWASIRAWDRGAALDWLRFGLILGAALLAKAYFLVLPVFGVGLLAYAMWWRRAAARAAGWFCAAALVVAGPWYIRNLVLYGSLSAKPESAAAGIRHTAQAAWELPWRESIVYMAHTSLWTGNNSFTTFSSATLNVMLVMIAVGLALNLRRKKLGAAAVLTASAVVLFCAALAYIDIAFFESSKGAVWAAVPWYMQVLLAPVLLLVFRGAGVWLARATVVAWCYLLAATYLFKLLPMYAGFEQPRARLGVLWNWFLHGGAQRSDILQTLCLANSAAVMPSIALVVVLDVLLCAAILWRYQGASPN